GPSLAVGGRPDVVLEARVVAEIIVFRPPEDPQASLEGHRAGGEPRAPTGPVGRPLPRQAVARGPGPAPGAVPREPAGAPPPHQPHPFLQEGRHRPVAVFPWSPPRPQAPGLPVGRTPDISGRGGVRVDPPPEEPESVLVVHLAGGVARPPAGPVGHP